MCDEVDFMHVDQSLHQILPFLVEMARHAQIGNQTAKFLEV